MTKKTCGLVAFLAACAWAAPAPARAASREVERLQIQVATLQSHIAELQRAVAENGRETRRLADVLAEQNAALKKALQDGDLRNEATQNRLSEIAERLADISERFSGGGSPAATTPTPAGTAAPLGRSDTGPPPRATPPPPPAPLPGELFSQAYADYTRGQYDLALQEFREYLKRFPETERTDDAQYWIGVCLAGKQQYAEAVAAWDALIVNFPASDKRPDSHVKKGGALEKLGKRREALTQYRFVVDHYPNSPAAKIAGDKLNPTQ
jgi:tol-pal system protein YbgF